MAVGKRVDVEGMIKWFSELSNKDVGVAGGKGASLSEMYNHGFPVPPGFLITAQAFDYFLKSSGIKEEIKEMMDNIDIENTEELDSASRKIRSLIEAQEIPYELNSEILEAYHILGNEKIKKTGISETAFNILKNSFEPSFVSVRSSATTEDLADASFAGQQESFLNVKGDFNLLEKIKKCFSSLYTPRAIYYREKKGFGKMDSLLAVVVQKMIDSGKSGVIFSKDPVNLDNNIVIEAVYGLGEGIVSGRIQPDNYIVSNDLEIKSIKIAKKKIAIVRSGSGENIVVKLNDERAKSQVLSEGEIIRLADYSLKLEEHYKKPQDIEFAIEEGRIYIVQSRPITTLGEKNKSEKIISGNVILSGQAASPGIGVGVVRIVEGMKDLEKIKKGDVLVTEMTNPDMVVAMQKSVAIVTDEGGMTSHASIVSREMGIPCVVGTENATSVLKDGMKVTVDGNAGKIYSGEVSETKFAEVKKAVETSGIKLKLILDLPDFVDRAAESGLRDVGLQRIEGIIAESGKHPLLFEKENNMSEYVEILKKGIEKIADKFDSVWIRTSDIRTDEFSNLKGAPEKELNPMLGFHGIRFSLKHPKIFEAELEAINKIALKFSDKKFGVMFPQVISVDEVISAKEHFSKYKRENIEFGIMVETPAAVQIIEEICREGIDFISFGTNDLTQFVLAIDRGNEDVQYIYNEMNPAVLSAIKRVIGICKRHNVKTSICGQAGSRKEMIEYLYGLGIDSISVNADAALEASVLINELEKTGDNKTNDNKKYIDNQQYLSKQINPGQVGQSDIDKNPVRFQRPPGSENWSKSKWKRWKKKNKARSLFSDKRGIASILIDNLESVEEKSEEIQDDVKMENEIQAREQEEFENKIEVEKITLNDNNGEREYEDNEEKLDNQEFEADFRDNENIEETETISELFDSSDKDDEEKASREYYDRQ